MSKKRNFYEISIDHELHFINFKCRLTCPVDGIVKISLWRPGRYEFGDFAKNIRNFCAYDENDLELKVHKHSRNSYRIFGASRTEIIICYQYYAHELNAGSSFSDGTYLYINPINCFVYSDESKELPHQVNLQVPENWTIAGVPGNTSCFELPNFDRMVDTPFIASPNLNITKFEVNNISFRIVIQGYYDVIQEKVISDFKKFCKRQLADFTYFPSKQYEFLVISPDYFIYHGVEHLNSTVITLGPNKKLFDELYTEFLGVSSHELYHVWNVKSFRPKEMTPYLYDTENYSRFGFIYEGVTTYLGDLYLLKSGVFDITQYFKELEAQFDKHGRNDGRFNYSLGDSSIDTWIDGYTPGIPDRKVSIYTEGCLFALLLDIEIIKRSKAKYSITDFMRLLSYYKNGYSMKEIEDILFKLTGFDFGDFFDTHINKPVDYIPILSKEISNIGVILENSKSKHLDENFFGFKYKKNKFGFEITSIHHKSQLAKVGLLVGDIIEKVDDQLIDQKIGFLISSKKEVLQFCILRGVQKIKYDLSTKSEKNHNLPVFKLRVCQNMSPKEKNAFKKWIE